MKLHGVRHYVIFRFTRNIINIINALLLPYNGKILHLAFGGVTKIADASRMDQLNDVELKLKKLLNSLQIGHFVC